MSGPSNALWAAATALDRAEIMYVIHMRLLQSHGGVLTPAEQINTMIVGFGTDVIATGG